MYPLAKVAADLYAESIQHTDFTTDFATLIGGISHVKDNVFRFVAPDNSEYVFGEVPFLEFVKARLGGNTGFFKEKSVSGNTKLSYIYDKAGSLPNHDIVVRCKQNSITGIVSRRYQFIDNRDLAVHLMTLIEEKKLPEETMAHTYHLRNRNLNMRIIAPKTWNHRIGNSDYYAAVSIRNNELGNGSVQIASAIARVACFNYTLSDNLFSFDHQWNTADDAKNALTNVVSHIQKYSDEMIQQMTVLNDLSVVNPEGVFRKVAKDLKLPTRVQEDMREYWNNEGSGNSLYDIVQAVTYASQRYTSGTSPKWDMRDTIEEGIWRWGTSLLEDHQSGTDINEAIESLALIRKGDVLEAVQDEDSRYRVQALQPVAWA